MKRVKAASLLIIMSAISFLMITCKHEIPGTVNGGNGSGNGNPTKSSTCSADTAYFATEILPLINSNCATSGCHDAISRKEGVELTSYSKIRGYVTPFNGANSKLYNVIIKTNDDRMPPAPLSPMAAAQIAKILKWINQGALNNQCTGGCDSTVFTY